MSRCKYCDAENPEDARFCGSCGQTGQNAPRTELGKPLEVDASHDANRERIASDEGQKAAQGDIVLSFDQAHNAPASAHVPTLQGTPQIGHVPTVQGIPTTPQPPGSAAPPPASHAPATSASQATHAMHAPSHMSGPSATHAQHTGATHAQDQFRHSQPGHSAAQNAAAHAAVKGGISVATKIIVTIIAAVVIAAGGAGAFAIARQHQSSSHAAPPSSKHSSGTAISTKSGPNTFIVTGAVNGLLTNVKFENCGYTVQMIGYDYDVYLSGTLNNQNYTLDVAVVDESPNGAEQYPGTYSYPAPSSALRQIQAELDGPTQIWQTDGNRGHGSVTINPDNASGTVSSLTVPVAKGTGDEQITISGNWLCPASFAPTPTAPAVTNNVFTISGAVNGTLTLTSYITCGMTPSGSAVGDLATGTLNGQTYHLIFLFPHYHGPGTYTDPSSPANVTMNFNDGTHTWSTNGSDAQGRATVNSDNNSGSFSSFTIPGISGVSGTHVTVDGSWACQ